MKNMIYFVSFLVLFFFLGGGGVFNGARRGRGRCKHKFEKMCDLVV